MLLKMYAIIYIFVFYFLECIYYFLLMCIMLLDLNVLYGLFST